MWVRTLGCFAALEITGALKLNSGVTLALRFLFSMMAAHWR
jgi:hypothetical protein